MYVVWKALWLRQVTATSSAIALRGEAALLQSLRPGEQKTKPYTLTVFYFDRFLH